MNKFSRRQACKTGIGVGLLPSMTLASGSSRASTVRTHVLIRAYSVWQNAFGDALPGSYVSAIESVHPVSSRRDIVMLQYARGDVMSLDGYRVSLYELATLATLGRTLSGKDVVSSPADLV